MSTTRSPVPKAPAISEDGPADWRDAALVLLAHGSAATTAGPPAIARHAAALTQCGLFAEIHLAFLHGTPRLTDILARIESPTTYLVPFFMSAGHSVRQALAEHPLAGGSGSRLRRCRPAGSHPDLAAIVAARVDAARRARDLAAADITVILVGHGSPNDPASAEATRRCAARLAGRGGYGAVRCAFLDQAPRPDAALTAGPSRAATIVVGLFADNGLHAEADMRRLLGLDPRADGPAGARRPIDGELIYTGAIGPDPACVALILDRVREQDDRTRAGIGSCPNN